MLQKRCILARITIDQTLLPDIPETAGSNGLTRGAKTHQIEAIAPFPAQSFASNAITFRARAMRTRVLHDLCRAFGVQHKRGYHEMHAEPLVSNTNAGTTECTRSLWDPSETRVLRDPCRAFGVHRKRGCSMIRVEPLGSIRNAGTTECAHSLWDPSETRVPRNARTAFGIQQKRGCFMFHVEPLGSNKNAGALCSTQSLWGPTKTRVLYVPRRVRGIQ